MFEKLTLTLNDLVIEDQAESAGKPLFSASSVRIGFAWSEISSGRLQNIHAEGVDATLRPGRESMSASLGAERIAIDVQGVREKLERVEAETRIAPMRIDVRSLGVTWEGQHASSAGRVDGPFDAPRIDVTVRGDVDVAAVGARAGSPWKLAGLVRASGRLQGQIESPKV